MATDNLWIAEKLSALYPEIDARTFYRNIFPPGSLEQRGAHRNDKNEMVSTGKYNAIAVELQPKDSEYPTKRHIITDDLNGIDLIVKNNNFTIISPIDYAGRTRESKNARNIYALAIDLDGIETEGNFNDLIHQVNNKHLPRPTYMVWSGSGIHLYYQFYEPFRNYENIVKELQKLKDKLTRMTWNAFITTLSDKIQIGSLFQGFRAPGTITKGGHRARAFITGEKVDIDYLNSFIKDEKQRANIRENISLAEAEILYPEWYERKIINKRKTTIPASKKHWVCHPGLYNWWLNRIKINDEATTGHRYFCIMVLSVYAKKSNIPYEQLEKDAFELQALLDSKTTDENNHFTREDIMSALQSYNDNYYTFPIDTISELTAMPIVKNKRNGIKQDKHLYLARRRKEDMKALNIPFKNPEGRPNKWEKEINDWLRLHPGGTRIEKIKQCMSDLNISRATAYRYIKN